MKLIAIKSASMAAPKILAVAAFGDDDPEEVAQDTLESYYVNDPSIELYEVREQPSGYVLRKLRVKPGSEVREERIKGARFE